MNNNYDSGETYLTELYREIEELENIEKLKQENKKIIPFENFQEIRKKLVTKN